MKGTFAPYLSQILPPIINYASLKPSMGIADQGDGDIEDVLSEIKTTGADGEKKANLVTDEIEEKDTAIQMITVFLEELGGECSPYLDQIAQILLANIEFSASEQIRISAASALPACIQCAKAANAPIENIHTMAKQYSNNIIEAMESETETDCLVEQAKAIKEIVEEAGENLLQPDSVDQFTGKILEFINQSSKRIVENNKYEKES
jgi:archaellum component FlaC